MNNWNTSRRFQLAARDALITALILLAAGLLCLLLRIFWQASGHYDNYVSMIFILAVFLIARFTDGYLPGIAASFISVLAVNYIFTFPYFAFNFTLAGYPIAIISMLAVSLTTSALTSKAKQSQQIEIEIEKEKTRSNLLRAVSHDLRTPLTSILGATQTVIEHDALLTSQERRTLLTSVQDDAQWLIHMVENLLAITRIEGESRAKLVKYPEAAEEIVADAVRKFRKRFPDQSVSSMVPDELLMVPMDAVLIEQVLINLLENAALHGRTVDKILLTVSKNQTEAVFEVRDNGVGIPSDILEKIRAGSYISCDEDCGDDKKNMGIGLSVCRTIINAHGGRISAKNAKEGGAVFAFCLPLEENIV